MSFDSKAWNKDLDQRVTVAAEQFGDFVRTVAALRHPITGCPWDLEQNHQSLRRFMLEEAYEAADAMLHDDRAHLLEELGDVLLQVVLNAQVAHDQGRGDITHVVEGINRKMRRRHPHVFALSEGEVKPDTGQIKKVWDAIKAEEKSSSPQKQDGTFAEAEKVLPALTQAYKIGKKAQKIDFDWDRPLDVLAHLRSELVELEAEIQRGDQEKVRIELGDVFFCLAQLSRHLGFEPESIAQEGNSKFLDRFKKVENLARDAGLALEKLPRVELEKLWLQAKEQK